MKIKKLMCISGASKRSSEEDGGTDRSPNLKHAISEDTHTSSSPSKSIKENGFALSPEEELRYMQDMEQSMRVTSLNEDDLSFGSEEEINVDQLAVPNSGSQFSDKLDASMEEARRWMDDLDDLLGKGGGLVENASSHESGSAHGDLSLFPKNQDFLLEETKTAANGGMPKNLPREISLIQVFEDPTRSVCSVAALNRNVVVSGHNDGTILAWSLSSGKTIRTLTGHSDSIFSIATVNENRILSGSDDKLIKLWDYESGRCLSTFAGHANRVTSVAVVGHERFTSGSDDRTIRLWDMETGRCIRSFNHGYSECVYAVAALENSFNMGSDGNIIRVWNSETGKCVKKMSHHSVFSLAAVGQDQFLSCALDKTIKLWNVHTGQCVHTFQGHSGGVWSVAAIHGDQKFVSGSSDGHVKLWDLSLKKQKPLSFEGHARVVTSVASMGPQRFISGSLDRTIKVWQLDTLQMEEFDRTMKEWKQEIPQIEQV